MSWMGGRWPAVGIVLIVTGLLLFYAAMVMARR